MTQQQIEIPVILNNGVIGTAVATGNNASWHCYCQRNIPLLGKSGQVKGPSENLKIVCPDCGAEYFVEPDGGDYKKAVRVIEL
ncbi:hypothetical protein JWJ90_10495 [Desulfobulbus rhabdoformis]|uniref:hypothetical protein n=1 Tax=Desulfobulbus rhabdoformis TaxID=34032 RepID=UPI001962DA29|nr:hypothetical protein [Desulfobulbus rhabdoformis]MBM9614714.1 hypothetical protein [Desulfobulbus rhabdoformis]